MLQKLTDNQMNLLHDFETAINKKELTIQEKQNEILTQREQITKLTEINTDLISEIKSGMGLDLPRIRGRESYDDKKRMPPTEVMVTFERRESDPTIEQTEDSPVQTPQILGVSQVQPPPSVFELQRPTQIGESVNIILSGASQSIANQSSKSQYGTVETANFHNNSSYQHQVSQQMKKPQYEQSVTTLEVREIDSENEDRHVIDTLHFENAEVDQRQSFEVKTDFIPPAQSIQPYIGQHLATNSISQYENERGGLAERSHPGSHANLYEPPSGNQQTDYQ